MVRMLCRRSASLMTSTRGSLAMATTILRTVSACAASPNLTLSSLVTPSTSRATCSPKSRRSASSPYSVSSTVSWRRPAIRVAGSMPSSARMVVTASGWVMYGSPLLRFWPRCQRSATWKARSIWRSPAESIFGSLLRTMRSNGSSTGLYGVERCTPRRASRARTRLEEPPERAEVSEGPERTPRPLGASADGRGPPPFPGAPEPPGADDGVSFPLLAVSGWASSGKGTPQAVRPGRAGIPWYRPDGRDNGSPVGGGGKGAPVRRPRRAGCGPAAGGRRVRRDVTAPGPVRWW
ncbi:exported protein of unknown function [Streptantibioticus cattleyicolor NRRL 8057 = DSM 46488]|nr:exported protein of unknown function [Streptantibioticus cattleyicolor NRRL 8057 = DSM 46488]